MTNHEKFIRILELKTRASKVYDEMDRLTEELAESGCVEFPLGGSVAVITDQFSGKSLVYKVTSVKRYELSVPKKIKSGVVA